MKFFFNAVIIATLSTLFLVSCGGEDESKVKNELNIGIHSDLSTIDPAGHNEMLSSYATHSIYDTLFRANSLGFPELFLAKEYKYTSETELEIKIHEGVKFHDGSELKSDDVKASLDRAREMKDVAGLYTSITAVDIVDEYTILIKTKAPFAPLLANLSHSGAGIAPKELVESNDFNNPIGSGPYKFVKWISGDVIQFERFDDYFFENEKPEFKYLNLKVMPESTSRTIALETGEVDFITLLDSIDYNRVMTTKGIEVVEGPSNNLNYFFTNMEKEPFNDINFRKALNYGIDKDAVKIVATEGLGNLLNSITPSNILGYNEDIVYEYNIEKAKEYLEKSNYNGRNIVIFTSGDERRRASEVIQNSLSTIGIKTTIETMDLPKYIEVTSNGKFEMGVMGWTTATDPDRYFSPLLHSKSINGQNRARYSNYIVDEKIDKGISILDVEERKKIYEDVYRIVMDEAPWVPLYSKKNIMGGSSNLTYENVYTAEGSIYFNLIKSKK